MIGRLPFDSSVGSGGQFASILRSQSKTLESACANACIVGPPVVDLRKVMSTKIDVPLYNHQPATEGSQKDF